MGFREDLALTCLPAIEAVIISVMDANPDLAQKYESFAWNFVPLDKVTKIDGREVRELWECAKIGNAALDLIRDTLAGDDDDTDTGEIDPRFIRAMFSMPGFLTGKEKTMTAKLAGHRVDVWRGGALNEHSSGCLGLSWTADEQVAKWFAARRGATDRALFYGTAGGEDCYALDTSESEIIVVGDVKVTAVTPADASWEAKMNWETRKATKPRLAA
jgi:hypothetical protein